MIRQTPICRVQDLVDGEASGVSVNVDGGERWDLIVMRRGGEVFVYHNECPHAGRNLDYAPGRFLVKSGVITCAVHGACFDVASGACRGGPARSGLVGVSVKVIDGAVWLLEAPTAAADPP